MPVAVAVAVAVSRTEGLFQACMSDLRNTCDPDLQVLARQNPGAVRLLRLFFFFFFWLQQSWVAVVEFDGRRLATGGWRLAAGGGRRAAGGWWLVAGGIRRSGL